MRLRRWLLLVVAALTLEGALHRGDAVVPIAAELRLAVITQTFSRAGTTSTNRSINALYHCDRLSPEGTAATLEVPAGLGVANPVPIVLHTIDGEHLGVDTDMRVYWGSAERIPLGQPRPRRGAGGVRFHSGTMGMADPTRLTSIDAGASASGPYRVKVSEVGEGAVSLSDAQTFLEPLQITEPSNGRVDFSHPIRIAWKPLPRAAAYRVTAESRTGDGRVVLWENAWRSDSWEVYDLAWALRNHRLLPPDQTAVSIPPGVFMGGPVLLRVTAYTAQVRGRGVVKPVAWAESTTSMELGGR